MKINNSVFMTLSQRQTNVMLTVSPDAYTKGAYLCMLRNYCFLLQSPPQGWYIWLFQANMFMTHLKLMLIQS